MSQKLTELTEIIIGDLINNDELYVVDTSDGISKRTSLRAVADYVVGDTNYVTTTGEANKLVKTDADGILNLNQLTANQIYADEVIENTGAYGLRWNRNDDTYERLGNAVGKTAGTDFNSIYPWNSIKRCVMNSDITVNYYLDPNNSGLKAEGGSSTLTGADGEVMVEIPRFYFKKVTYTNLAGEKIHEWWISEFKRAGYRLHPAFYDNGEQKSYIYIGAFEGYHDTSVTNVLRSRSGVQPTADITLTSFRTYAQAVSESNNKWHVKDYAETTACQLLYLIEYANFNSQDSVLGISEGITDLDAGTVNHSQNTGHTVSLGNYSGEVAITSLENEATGVATTYACSYRGIENMWGNIWEWQDGILVTSDGMYISDDVENYNDTATNYDLIPLSPLTSSGNAYDIYSEENFENGFIASSLSGSSAQYLTDYWYAYNGVGAIRALRLGGHWTYGLVAGAFALAATYAPGDSDRSLGARLCVKK